MPSCVRECVRAGSSEGDLKAATVHRALHGQRGEWEATQTFSELKLASGGGMSFTFSACRHETATVNFFSAPLLNELLQEFFHPPRIEHDAADKEHGSALACVFLRRPPT